MAANCRIKQTFEVCQKVFLLNQTKLGLGILFNVGKQAKISHHEQHKKLL